MLSLARMFRTKVSASIEKAYSTALSTLKDRYASNGIHAGKSHFSDVWLRDGCYAAFGSLSVGDVDIVKTTLTTVIEHMSPEGQVPLRVGQKWFLLKYFGLNGKKPQARFTEDKGISIPTDSNSLMLITAGRYLDVSKDRAFVLHYYDQLKKAADWNFSQDSNHDLLIEEGYYAGWADSLKKKGTVLYTNVLHYQAMISFSRICETLGRKTESSHYQYLASCIRSKLQELFWNGDYFIDWIDMKGKKQSFFSTDGNVFAIIFGIAEPDQAVRIQRYITFRGLDQGFSTHSVFPNYEWNHVYSIFFPLKMADYHNGLEWLWLGCADAVAKHLAGLKDEAYELLDRIAKKIVEHDGVYEVYDKGVPVQRLFYKSEHWFAWSSGLFVWACHELGVIKGKSPVY